MRLKCKVCGEDIAFAKFYPKGGFITGPESPGWYVPSQSTITERMNKFFEDHEHGLDSSDFGGWQYLLDYDVDKN